MPHSASTIPKTTSQRIDDRLRRQMGLSKCAPAPTTPATMPPRVLLASPHTKCTLVSGLAQKARPEEMRTPTQPKLWPQWATVQSSEPLTAPQLGWRWQRLAESPPVTTKKRVVQAPSAAVRYLLGLCSTRSASRVAPALCRHHRISGLPSWEPNRACRSPSEAKTA